MYRMCPPNFPAIIITITVSSFPIHRLVIEHLLQRRGRRRIVFECQDPELLVCISPLERDVEESWVYPGEGTEAHTKYT